MNKYLNIGCGSHYSKDKQWINLDFISLDNEVISHNLLKGIPFNNNEFDFVYHSHVLEHFKKADGRKLLNECYRVLKPGGILRIVVPDLEQIVRNYLSILEQEISSIDLIENRLNYEWIILEMYDQTIREKSGGEMYKYLTQDEISNENYVFKRIGKEGLDIRNNYLNSKANKVNSKINFLKKIFIYIRTIINNIKFIKYYKLGKFRYSGEIHQNMYDRFSLKVLLIELKFINFEIKTSTESFMKNWADFNLDTVNGITRKPDSLFVEVRKPF